MRKGTHIVGAFARAMDEGRLEDATAILQEMGMDHLRAIIFGGYYIDDRVRSDTTGALLERFAGW